MQTIDPVAVVVNWYDAYRAADLASIVGLYNPDATIHCTCQGREIAIGGEASIRSYWTERLRIRPCLELEDLQPKDGTVAVFYSTDMGVIRTTISLNEGGKIASTACSLLEHETSVGSCCTI